jgi:pimeloyl-ACP methyl ester carboxylesterase
MRRLVGLRDFVHDAIEKTTDLVEETHDAAARKPIAVMEYIEPLGALARAVDLPRSAIAKLVFDRIRATNRTVQAVSDVGYKLVEAVLPAELPIEHTPFGKVVSEWTDRAESALNAVAGDFLEARENGLSIKLSLRWKGHDVSASELARQLTGAKSKVCIFVHGLGCSDSVWRDRDPSTGAEVSFGRQLAEEHGYTSLYVRYNTGLHISQNGRALALLLDALALAYPVELTQIALVGHSMGGLVARSAAHYGKALEQAWIRRLSHVLCIGSPHFGAPLERASNVLASVLGFFDVAGTQVPAKLLNARSAGVKDLRFGSVLDEDWLTSDPDAFFTDTSKHAPFVEGVAYGYVAAHLKPASGAVGELLGDLLVQLPSATGRHRDETRHLPFHMGHVLEGVHHVALTNHPAVYPQIVRFLSTSVPPADTHPA